MDKTDKVDEFFQLKKENCPENRVFFSVKIPTNQETPKKSKKNKVILASFVFLFAAALGIAYFFVYFKPQEVADNSFAQENIQNSETANLNNEVQIPTSQEVIPVQDSESEELSEKKEEKVKISVYNGTNITGLAAKLAQKISTTENMEIIQKTNAKGNYQSNLIIDISGGNDNIIKKIIEIIGGEMSEIPENEIKPEADILIIGGIK